jgi:hypothetical protein
MKTSLFFHSKHKSGGESTKKKKKKKKNTTTTTTMSQQPLQKVVLNVYDLHDSNQYLYALGMGVFHSGVEINGTEWSFGACATGSGVFNTTPRVPLGTSTFRESIEIGTTTLSRGEINDVIGELSAAYQGSAYNLTSKNCNTFSNALCMRLCNRPIPGWVNRIADLGAIVNSIVPLSSLGLGQPTKEDAASASSASASSSSATTTTPFGGVGHSLTDSPVPSSSSSSTTVAAAATATNTGTPATTENVIPAAEELRLRRLAAIEKRLGPGAPAT